MLFTCRCKFVGIRLHIDPRERSDTRSATIFASPRFGQRQGPLSRGVLRRISKHFFNVHHIDTLHLAKQAIEPRLVLTTDD